MRTYQFLSFTVIVAVLVSCSPLEPLNSPKTAVKKEEVKKTVKKSKTAQLKPKTVSKTKVKPKVKAKSKPKAKPKTVSKPKTKSKPRSSIKPPSIATSPIREESPVIPKVVAPKIGNDIPEKPVAPKPVVKKSIPTAAPVLGRAGFVHNPYNFDEHIDVQDVGAGSIVTPQGDPDKHFRVP